MQKFADMDQEAQVGALVSKVFTKLAPYVTKLFGKLKGPSALPVSKTVSTGLGAMRTKGIGKSIAWNAGIGGAIAATEVPSAIRGTPMIRQASDDGYRDILIAKVASDIRNILATESAEAEMLRGVLKEASVDEEAFIKKLLTGGFDKAIQEGLEGVSRRVGKLFTKAKPPAPLKKLPSVTAVKVAPPSTPSSFGSDSNSPFKIKRFK